MKVIVITGPSGAGKTTVSEEFTKRNKTYANIDVDHLKHMNPNAFTKVINDDGSEDFPYSAWRLLGKKTAILAKSYIDYSLDVIINGYLEVEAWEEIEKQITIDYRLLLLPAESANIERDSQRTKEVQMGQKAVKRGQKHFKEERFFKKFELIDTSNHSLLETVELIEEMVK